LRATLERWRTAPASITDIGEELWKVDEAIAALRAVASSLRQRLEMATSVLQRFNAWQAAQSIQQASSAQDAIDDWLELQAMADLVAKYHDVAATIELARARGWHPHAHAPIFAPLHESPERLEFLRKCRDDLARERDEARARVRKLTEQARVTAGDQTPTTVTTLPPTVTHEQAMALDEVGARLPSMAESQTGPSISEVFRAAAASHTVQARGKNEIGSAGGLKHAIREAELMTEAVRALETSTMTAHAAYEACRVALTSFGDLEKKDDEALQTFFRRLEQRDEEGMALLDALNELLSLFKPAPWAYAGITMQAVKDEQAGGERLALRRSAQDESEAELLYNTAEMNTFTLALFLLCAPVLDNPLKLLVLDDPLQNMDEMTVSSLARGLGKLMRIYPEGWRLLSLFHGEEDVYRIRDEVPSSVYRLPWVSPSDGPAIEMHTVVPAEQGTVDMPLQNLAQIVVSRPVVAPV